MTGRTISHYEIIEKIGAGGMGEIYKARDPRLNRTVAIKALPANSTGDTDRRRRFIQEAQAASGLNHPNIITIHDILSDEASDYMVMEFVDGKTLGDTIPKEGLNLAETLRYAVQIADALAAAHAAGIIHRDLKPGNVMITTSGRVKILDFGLAKVTPAQISEATQTIGAGPMTMEGWILGTVSYMSPEQAQGKKVDARSDIFAFGAVVYEMITGRKAFAGDSDISTLTAILRDEVKPIADYVPGVPPELEEIIGRALRKDPAQRWQSMQEVHGVLAALRQKFESGVLVASRVLPPPAPERPKRKGRMSPVAWAGMAFGMIMSIGGWWTATHRDTPRPQASTPAPVAVVPSPIANPEPAPPPVPKPEETQPPPATPVAAPPVKVAKKDNALTNDTILELVQAKVAEPVILSQIRSSAKSRFQLSPSEVIRLTKAGVSPAVLEAMRHPGGPVPAPAVTAAPAPNAAPPTAPVKLVEETKTVELTAGIPFEITLIADVAGDVEPNTPLRFKAKRDFAVGKDVVIAAGAIVQGEAAGVKKGILGLGAKQTFRLLTADAVDGTKVKVRAIPGKSDKAEGMLEPPGHRDKNVVAPAGSTYLAYIDGAQTVKVRK